MKIDEHEPAFPSGVNVTYGGLTKKEFFTALALQGVLADGNPRNPDDVAARAIRCVEATLRALDV